MEGVGVVLTCLIFLCPIRISFVKYLARIALVEVGLLGRKMA